MKRFFLVLFGLALAGCSGAPPSEPFRVRLSAAPPSAFEVPPEALKAPAEVLRQVADPTELFAADLVDFRGARLVPADAPSEYDQPLLDLLREFIVPGHWAPNSLAVEDGLLLVKHSPAVLAAVQSALRTLRDNRGRMIRSRVRMVSLRRDALASLENIPSVSGGLVGVFDRDALTQVLHGRVPNLTIAMPTCTTFHGQKSHVMFLSQKEYVAGIDVATGAPDPQLAIATEGGVVELRTMANGSRADEFLVSFEFQLAGPFELVDIPLGAGVVQMPAQGYARLSGRCALRSDQSLLLVTRNPDARKTEFPLLAVVITLDWQS